MVRCGGSGCLAMATGGYLEEEIPRGWARISVTRAVGSPEIRLVCPECSEKVLEIFSGTSAPARRGIRRIAAGGGS